MALFGPEPLGDGGSWWHVNQEKREILILGMIMAEDAESIHPVAVKHTDR